MKIGGYDYSINNKSFEIFLSGCDLFCKGCQNPQLWDFNNGNEITENTWHFITKELLHAGELVQNIFILGGDPMAQDIDELEKFISRLNTLGDYKIWMFTGHDISEVPERIKNKLDYIKYGAYRDDLPGKEIYGIKLISNNQNIIKLR